VVWNQAVSRFIGRPLAFAYEENNTTVLLCKCHYTLYTGSADPTGNVTTAKVRLTPNYGLLEPGLLTVGNSRESQT